MSARHSLVPARNHVGATIGDSGYPAADGRKSKPGGSKAMKTGGAVRKSVVLAASAAVALLALGCGEQKEKAAVEISAAQAVQETSPAPVAAASATTPEAGLAGESGGTTSAESLPPDVSAFATDSLVVPGSIVEITAQTSTDVTSLMLQDRLGHKYPFEYDSDAKAWRVHYRVPIRTEIDRLGLSVTATNDANRYKRVWVFLQVQGGVPKESEVAE